MRFWKDIPGQNNRIHVRERVCPISGPGLLSKSERKRRAREIIQASGVDSAERFNEVVKQKTGITFREQSEIWLQRSLIRKRRPIRVTTADDIRGAFNKWVFPALGDLPLSQAAKYPQMKGLIEKMNSGGLSPKTVNNYFLDAAAVVASADDSDGNPLYPRKWDPEKLDLPIVERKKQRRPTIVAETMTFFASCRNANERMLFVLLGAAEMGFGEALGLEIDKHLADDFTTILIRQQVKRGKITKKA